MSPEIDQPAMADEETPMADENPATKSASPANVAPVAAGALFSANERENNNDLPPQSDTDLLPVVGLGGSAGSISILQQFFGRIPTDLGVAYVVVVHMSPDHESQLPAILQARTQMPVVQVQNSVMVQPNHVYVIPPAYHLTMSDGSIHLSQPRQERGKRVAVDLFFRTLATTHRSKALAIVLSGSDGDGAIGIKRIKEHGGVTVAQDPEEAEHDTMPRAAIETGMVDWILSVEQMSAKVTEWIRNERRISLPAVEEEEIEPAACDTADKMALREVLTFLHTRTGHDFSHYKRATVLRRIMRRLQVNSLHTIPDYANFLRTHPGEAGALLQDLLISVTNFFRDPEAFRALDVYLPRLFRDKKPSESVRLWVPGCATGEEAYSLAILLAEYSETLDSAPEVQIFATDLDDQALRFAREGTYPATIAADVSPERLRRFFVFDQGRYRVKKEVRERILFAVHNLLKDSPFSRLDLISCRNLLIYFNNEAQNKVLDVFHFALNPNGLLFLGSSESADENALFAVQDKKYRIYERQPVSRQHISLLALPAPPLPRMADEIFPAFSMHSSRGEPRHEEKPTMSLGEVHLKLLEQVAPPSVLVNSAYEIVHLSEHAGQFLRFAGGEVSVNLLTVVHPSLRLELRTALFRAMQSGSAVDVPAIPLELDGVLHRINMRVRPLRNPLRENNHSNFVLIIFEQQTEGNVTVMPPPAPDNVAQRLEEELQQLKAYLRSSVEQYEASSEELKASNEELQAMNEEQRSASEELETSREEIQAANEELTTVNQELKSKIEELSRANADLQNLMASTDIATVFLNRELRINRYTPRAIEMFRFISTDIGRPLADLRHRFANESFIQDADEVLHSLTPIEREVQTVDGQWFLLRVSPYRTMEERIDGMVLTFVDISERKQAEEALRASEEHYRVLFGQIDGGIAEIDLAGKFMIVNDTFCTLVGYNREELLDKMRIADVMHQSHMTRGLELFEQAAHKGLSSEIEQLFIRKDGSTIWVHHSVAPILDGEGHPQAVAALAIDITERKRVEEELVQAHNNLEANVIERTAELERTNASLEREAAERRRVEQAREHLVERLVTVQEEERRRISRELHDSMGQQLTAILMRLQSLPEWPEPGPRAPSYPQQIEKLRGMVNDLIHHVQRMAWEMRPAALDNLGLDAALQQYVEEWSEQYATPANFVAHSAPDVPPLAEPIKVALYRVVQESLTNVQRHAQANNVSVVLERDKSSVAAIVEDDGCGFDVEKDENGDERSPSQRLGLLGMQERLELVGGTLTIESSPDAGTTVYARVPLSEKQRSEKQRSEKQRS